MKHPEVDDAWGALEGSLQWVRTGGLANILAVFFHVHVEPFLIRHLPFLDSFGMVMCDTLGRTRRDFTASSTTVKEVSRSHDGLVICRQH